MLLVLLSTSFVVGILAASLARLPLLTWALWLALPLASLYLFRDHSHRRANFCVLAFLLGAMRFTIAVPGTDVPAASLSLASLNERGAITLTGQITEPPDIRDRSTQLRVSMQHVATEEKARDLTGDALVIVPRELEVQYGDVIEFSGEPTTPFETEDFSYKDYLARQGIHSLVRVKGEVKILARGQGNLFFAWLYALRNHAYETVLLIFPEPAASLLAGILLGIDSGIPADLRDAFNRTNTAHIIAISGFNVSIIAGILSQFARRIFGERRTMPIVIGGLIVYTLLAGASASVVRAAIMGSLAVIALHYNRQNDTLNALFAAALVMSALNPYTLWDVGFQLSFLATLGLVLYTEPLKRAFEKFISRLLSHPMSATGDYSPRSKAERGSKYGGNPSAKQILNLLSDTFIVTLAAQITTMPLILLIFHRLSLIGLLSNLLVLPAQPPLMIWGGIATILGMIFLPLGQLVGLIAWAFLEWTIVVVQATASIPFSFLDIGKLDALVVAGYYLILFGVTRVNLGAIGERITLRPALAAGAALVMGVLIWNIYATVPDGKTRVVFVDADGAATFVQTPRGKKILIDGGQSPSALLAVLGQRMPFWERQIDLMVLTSADDEHLAGLVEALERYEVKQIVQVAPPAKPTVATLKWTELIAQKRVPSAPAEAGLQIALDEGVTLEFLSPPRGSNPTRAAIAQLRAGQIAFLFADAATVEDQAALVKANAELASAFLIAPRKIAPEFFNRVDAPYAIVFARKPSPDLLAELAHANILQTEERGTIEIIVDGQTMSVRTTR